MTDNLKYIFLDIDGVCTSCVETPGSFLNHADDQYGLSPKCIKRLIDFIDKTGAKVIISSNWRRFEPGEKWQTKTRGCFSNPMPSLINVLGRRYAGHIPGLKRSKSTCLKIWFADMNIDPEKCKYVIFDDDASEGFGESEFADHFVLTNSYSGVSERDLAKAEFILSN